LIPKILSVVKALVAQKAVAVAPLPLRAIVLHSGVAEPLGNGVEVNVTVPVGVAVVLALVTLAVKVTLVPFVRGFAVAFEIVVFVVSMLVPLERNDRVQPVEESVHDGESYEIMDRLHVPLARAPLNALVKMPELSGVAAADEITVLGPGAG
jgi:hypothetical protein